MNPRLMYRLQAAKLILKVVFYKMIPHAFGIREGMFQDYSIRDCLRMDYKFIRFLVYLAR